MTCAKVILIIMSAMVPLQGYVMNDDQSLIMNDYTNQPGDSDQLPEGDNLTPINPSDYTINSVNSLPYPINYDQPLMGFINNHINNDIPPPMGLLYPTMDISDLRAGLIDLKQNFEILVDSQRQFVDSIKSSLTPNYGTVTHHYPENINRKSLPIPYLRSGNDQPFYPQAPPLPPLPYGTKDSYSNDEKKLHNDNLSHHNENHPKPHNKAIRKSRRLNHLRRLQASIQQQTNRTFLNFMRNGILNAIWSALAVAAVRLLPILFLGARTMFRSTILPISGAIDTRLFSNANNGVGHLNFDHLKLDSFKLEDDDDELDMNEDDFDSVDDLEDDTTDSSGGGNGKKGRNDYSD